MFMRRTNIERETFFSNLWRLAFRNVDTIMAGDFNCVPDVRKDKWGGEDTFGDKGITQLNAFADVLSLEDVFRVKQPVDKLFTWFNGPHSVGSTDFTHLVLGDHKCVTINVNNVRTQITIWFQSPYT